jgi:hypothetical protein
VNDGGTDDPLAIAIARHLIGEPPRPEEITRWRSAIEGQGAVLANDRDRRLWDLIRRSPWLIGPVDAGLALVEPNSAVRHRLCLMLAVLEASPHYTHRFLSPDSGPLALLALVPRLALAALRSALGLILVSAYPSTR